MSTITFILRPANKLGEHPISVKHSSGTLTPFVKATGVCVPAKYFNTATGKVSSKLTGYAEFNAQIEQVRADVQKAAKKVEVYELELNRENISKEYNIIQEGKISLEANLRIIKKKYENNLEQLIAELKELELQVEEKKIRIRDYQMDLGLFEGKLLTTYIKRYRDTQKISDNTKRTYNNLLKYVNDFNNIWEITSVTPTTLVEFENYLIDAGLNNSSTNTYIKRIKTVCLKYADVMQLDKQAIKDHRSESKQLRKQDIVFLDNTELDNLKALEVPRRRQVVKDAFLLMSATGLRFSDSFLTPDKIKGNFIVLSTQKTNTVVKIPINATAREILERYNYTMPKQYLTNFNKVLKILAKQAGINELVMISKKVGATTTSTFTEKYNVISAHVARKTFISHSLASGVNPAVLKQWIGHSKMELMFTNYANGSMNTVEEMNKVTTV